MLRSQSVFKLSCLALSVAMVNSALAEDKQVKSEEAAQETVTVWGTEIQSTSLNLTSDDIQMRQADHLSDLLRIIPGVDVGGAHSLNQRITIRSMDDKDLRITIDGANQNTYMYHHMGNLQIHADILQSAEIKVGKTSVIDGGLGGVVNFKTKSARNLLRPGEEWGGIARATYEDNKSKAVSGTAYGQITERLDLLAYYNFVDRDNFEVGEGKIKDENGNKIPGTNGTVKGLDGEVKDALIKTGFDISDNQRIKFGFERYEDEGDYSYRPDMGLTTDLIIAERLGIDLTYPTEFTRDTYTLNYDAEFDATIIEASLFLNESELERDESGLYNWRPEFAGTVKGEADNFGYRVLANTMFDFGFDQSLKYGLEMIQYDTEYHFKSDDLAIAPDRRSKEDADNYALFVENDISITNDLNLILGVRYDDYSIDSTVVDKSYDETTYGWGLDYSPTDNLRIKASQTQLFKGPEIGEVFVGAGLYDTPNPDIKAETGVNSELSVGFEDQVLGSDRFTAGITLFKTEIDDYIYDNTINRNTKSNVGDMEITGYEAYLGYDLGPLKVLVTYSKADSELDAFERFSEFDGARLDREQGDTISLIVDYEMNPETTLHWDMLHVKDLHAGLDLDSTSLDSGNKKDGYTVHNLSARWNPKSLQGLTIIAGIDNLFDEYYASQSSRTGVSSHPLFGSLYLQDVEPGRNAKVTVSYQY
ncbi:TonB-dependent receptor [Aestuariirhabdus sp. Z084]|uniref:TonB-dependent receptor domain-containing protein n=1 Tax=Aestuariirhabdus haliotis TaxID=2918751 RepID=UPI00201B3846|nr:TonB-dependent receptor [Aestuariirhabdus haliotis]MCL6417608.1 TonB-dependent receptor [Aestuariirhabdus haliotis]MCL6421534.1 TonB-dependent receptor [Aestuariirhabdus haliotis]